MIVRYFNTVFDSFGGLAPTHNMTYTGFTNPDVGTIGAHKSQSYSQFVDLSNVDAAKAILPLGNNEDPDSPYFNNQAQMWADSTFHPAPLSESAVAAIRESEYTLDYAP